jgi:DNA-binding transcriptional regulator GbsR (MarR family)
MSDEFINTVPQKFPNTLNHKESIERPWDVTENNLISPQEKTGEELKRDDLTERIHTLYNELRSSLTVPSALKVDLKKAHRMLEEVSRIKIEVEKIIEMLEPMEKYMKERIK